ncbi:MAG TPA: Rieske 2Fe-2S domain-containing protein [Gammaproteobacteria bacterium]
MSAVARLCALGDVPDGGCLELCWGEGSWPLALFLVRRKGELYGYVNRCPHAGHELNLRANEFLTKDRELILCRSHGAQFRIDDGVCVIGPCVGARLRPLPLEIFEGAVFASVADLERLKTLARF